MFKLLGGYLRVLSNRRKRERRVDDPFRVAPKGLRVAQSSPARVSRFLLLFSVVALSGCGAISATTLRCGTDSNTSYVEVVSAPQSLSQNTRALAELCAFAYEGEKNESS